MGGSGRGNDDETYETLERARDFLLSDDGSLVTDDRSKDFVISWTETEGDSTNHYSGEIWLPPNTRDILHEFLAEQVDDCLDDVDEYRKPLKEYAMGLDDENYTEYVPTSSLPPIDQQEDLFTKYNLPDTTYEEAPKPDFQAIRVMDSHENIVLGLQYYWDRHLLGDTSLVNLLSGEEHYRPLDETVISIPSYLDAICFDGYVYILNRFKFEQMFGYKEEYQLLAEEMLDEIESGQIEFADSGFVSSTVEDNINLLRKFRKMKADDAYSQITPSRAKTIIDNYNFEGIDYTEQANGEMVISVANKGDVKELLKIFNDGHLPSPILDRKYQVGSKQQR